MDYWLCVYVCVFLCSHDNDSKCSHAKSQPQWNVWLIYVYLFSLIFLNMRLTLMNILLTLVSNTIRPT